VFKWLWISLSLSLSSFVYAQKLDIPWYVGASLGWGSTTWRALVPQVSNQNLALSMSTPVEVQEGGLLWGVGGGMEVIPQFQVEFNYLKYPNALVTFDPDSLYAFENDGNTSFNTNTYTLSLQGKFLVPWEDTPLRIFASAGAAWLNRQDELLKNEAISPTFGVGLNYGFNDHWMGEFGFVYTAGDGESELNPSADFMPFLYGIFTKIFYRFG
jgi:hypothetical protein